MSTEPLENLEELGRRAIACKRWRWMPGMAAWTVDAASGEVYSEGVRIVSQPWKAEGQSERVRVVVDLPLLVPSLGTAFTSTLLPDLTDPATLGCLLALVREAHGAPAAYFMGSVNNQWVVHHFTEPEAYWKSLTKWQPTEAEALVAALEVAP